MMIEARRGQLFQQSLLTDGPADSSWVETQIGVLKSPNVALNVVNQLHLGDDPEFTQANPDPIAKMFDEIYRRLGWARPEQPMSERDRVSQAVGAVLGGLDVRRMGIGYLIKIDVRGRNAETVVKIANAVVDAYVLDQMNAQYQISRRGSDWLQDRLQTLREQTAAAERAVVEFKQKYNMVSTGASGQLMSDQQLAEINEQVSTARAHVADIQARLARIEKIIRAEEPDLTDATMTDALSNPIITKLREKYLDLVNHAAEFSVRVGEHHMSVVNLRSQIKGIRKSIIDELGRIAETYKSEYVIAKQRLEEQETRLATQVSEFRATQQALITLNGLESSAQSYRKLYDNFLQLYTQALQQQSFPISEARLIAPASDAIKSSPRNTVVWPFALVAGGFLGIGIGTLKEFMDRRFRTAEQVELALSIECVALLPTLADTSPKLFRRGVVAAESRQTRRESEILATVTNAPLSPYAEALRSVKFAAERIGDTGSCKVIGVTSSLPGEGKSTLAVGLAQTAMRAGRTILVDCDLRNPSVSRLLAPQANVGLFHVLLGKCSLEEAVWVDPQNGLAFLPAVAVSDWPVGSEVLTSELTRKLFQDIRRTYKYAVVDLSPLVAFDLRITAGLVDYYVLVIEWGVTQMDVVQKALKRTREVEVNFIGAVLNKVNMKKITLYDKYQSAHKYYNS